MRILAFMNCLPKTRIEPVTVWILTLDFRLTGNIHLAAAARIVEIGGSQLQAGEYFKDILGRIFCNSVTVL
jgi:hypothetical protein